MKGFTLVELLGVMIIIAIISLIAFPPILNQLRAREGEIDEMTNEVVRLGVKSYIDNHPNIYGYLDGDIYCIKIDDLVKSGTLNDSIFDKIGKGKFVEVTVQNEVDFTLKVKSECVETNKKPPILDDN